VFIKGTGDGMMIVSERDWFAGQELSEKRERGAGATIPIRIGHASAFLRASIRFIRQARSVIPRELAIGCGIDAGELHQVFVLGQSDYLGEAANNAAKLQQLAWDEVVISGRVAECLQADGEDGVSILSAGKPLADRGIRIALGAV